MTETIFSKIIDKKIPADIVFENDFVLAFRDINPVAPIHFLIIPKKFFKDILDVEETYLVELHKAIKVLVEKFNLNEEGFRVVTNSGFNAGQSVFHLHLHLIAGRKFSWPPG